MVSDQGIDGLCQPWTDYFDNSLSIGLLSSHLAGSSNLHNKGRVMCYRFFVTMHVNDPLLPVARVEHYALVEGFCLSLYSLHVLERGVDMMQSINQNHYILKQKGLET